MSSNQIELVFNREIRGADLNTLRNGANWRVHWTPAVTTGSYIAGNTYTSTPGTLQRYQWKNVCIQISGRNFLTGAVGTDIRGYTQQDINERRVSAGGWISNTAAPNAYALQKGEYVNIEALQAKGYGINGTLVVQLLNNGNNIRDWADNPLGNKSWTAIFKPHLGQVFRSKEVGVYIYADNPVAKSSLEIAGAYIDQILSNKNTITTLNGTKYDRVGQRLADGLVNMSGGLQIIAYGNHAYMQPGLRNTYNTNYQYYLYVEGFGGSVAQTTEFNLLRDFTFTRYDNYFILGHEFGHSLETAMQQYASQLYSDIGTLYTRAKNTGKWLATYPGSNRAEYWATLSNIWHGTDWESTTGMNDGTWTPVVTREELIRHDPEGFELCKKVYFNGNLNMNYNDGTPVEVSDWQLLAPIKHPDYPDDIKFESENDLIKWGFTFPYSWHEEDPAFMWTSWSTINQFGLKMRPDGINFEGYDWLQVPNYNPFRTPPGVVNPKSAPPVTTD
jgi:hypothetical protein